MNATRYKATAVILMLALLLPLAGCSPAAGRSLKSAPQSFRITWDAWIVENDSVGNNWDNEFTVNGEAFVSGGTVVLEPGSSLTVGYRIVEVDEYPDESEYFEEIPYSAELCTNGIEVSEDIVITEGNGRFAGNVAVWRLEVSIVPVS